MFCEKKRKRRKKGKAGIAGAIVSILAVSALVFTLLPAGTGVYAQEDSGSYVSKVTDPPTVDTWKEVVENTTMNTGRIWTDKTVSDGDLRIGGHTISKSASSDFLITLSALSSTSNLQVSTAQPLDIVLVLDTSGSMDEGMTSPVYADDLDRSETYLSGTGWNAREVFWDPEKASWGYQRWGMWHEVIPSDGPDDSDPGHTQLYISENKMLCLKAAVNGFLGSAEAENKRQPDKDKHHQIGIISYESEAKVESDLKVCMDAGKDDLISAVDSLEAGGATNAADGFLKAEELLNGSRARADAEKIVIFFTDGVPTTSREFSDEVADSAVRTSGGMKAEGAKVFSVGIFSGADPSSLDTTSSREVDKANCFMNAVSSNYPEAVSFREPGARSDEDVQYYKTAAEAGDISSVFEEIFEELTMSAGSPTHIDSGNPADSDGYITITDPLGDYMQIKGFNSIVYGDNKYTDPVKHTTGNTDTYVFEGVNAGNDIYPEANLNKILITVERSEKARTGDKVTVQIPAALLPLRTFNISDTSGSSINTTVKNAMPVRINYEAALKPEVKALMADPDDDMKAYIKDNVSEGSNVSFYANSYIKEDKRANVITEFVPSATNNFYYVTNDAKLYSDRELTKPVRNVEPGMKLFYGEIYFSTESSEPMIETLEFVMPDDDISMDYLAEDENGQYYIKAGTWRYDFVNKTKRIKDSNPTGTAAEVIHPLWDVSDPAHIDKINVYLGNNGKLEAELPGSLVFSKTADADTGLEAPDAEFGFSFMLKTASGQTDEREYRAVRLDREGRQIGEAFMISSGDTFRLKAGEHLKVTGLKAGASYEITETASAEGFSADTERVTGNIEADKVSRKTVKNTYSSTGTLSGSAELEITKKIDGRNWKDTDSFTFYLHGGNDLTDQAVKDKKVILPDNADGITVSADTPGHKAAFGDIIFKQPGEYIFHISESPVQDPSMTAGQESETIKVQVSDNGDGTMDCDVISSSDMEVTNTFTPPPVQTDIRGLKELDGRELHAGEFTFRIEASGDAPLPAKTAVTNDAEGAFAFTDLRFDAPGTYEYTVKEDSGTIPGVTYDTSEAAVTVTVRADRETGLLSASVSYTGGTSASDDMIFTNTYMAEPTDPFTGMRAEKKVKASEGNTYTMKGGEFSFSLTPGEQNPASDPVKKVKNVTNDSSGNAVFFDEIIFTEPGTYVYTVSESSSTAAGMSTDPDIYTITVDVTDDKIRGKLTADAVITNGDKTVDKIEFVNEYAPGSASAVITGMKTLAGKDLSRGDFTFVLEGEDIEMTAENTATGEFAFDAITYDRPGTYEYTVKEKDTNRGGYTYDSSVYDVRVTVSDDSGMLKAEVSGAEDILFENSYRAAATDEMTVSASKILNGRDLEAGEFTFQLRKGDIVIARAVNDAGGNVTFTDPVRFTEEGEYTFTICEEQGVLPAVDYSGQVYTAEAKVEDRNGQLEVTSVRYYSGGQQISAENVTFTNTYTPVPAVVETGSLFSKEVTGREWQDGEKYSFLMRSADGTPEAELTAEAGKPDKGRSASFGFGNLTFDDEGTYRYTVTEQAGDDKEGMTYDRHTATLTITVEDTGGRLEADVQVRSGTFTNSYRPDNGTLSGKEYLEVEKVLEGRNWAEGDRFTFTLSAYGEKTEKAVKEGRILLPENASGITADKNDSDRKAAFGDITFKDADEYSFVIKEKSGSLENMTYDTAERIITVTSADNKKGNLICTAVTSGDMTFTNVYTPSPVSVSLDDGRKVLENRDIRGSDKFTFKIEAEGDAPLPAMTEVTAGSDGNISFPAVTYDEEGTYRYIITEKAGDIPGITYDTSRVEAEVTVANNKEKGRLDAEVRYSRDGENASETYTFTNVYKAAPTDTVTGFSVKKKVTASAGNSYTMKGGEFAFRLVPSQTNPASDPVADVLTAENDSSGNAVFTEGVKYTESGTYIYNVTENNTSQAGINYDDSLYVITVEVDDPLEGKLTADVTVTENGKAADLVFVNTYDPAETSAVINGQKILSGKDSISDDMFSFILSGDASETVSNKGAAFSFSELTYKAAGTYDYQVREKTGNQRGYTYDDTVYDVTVKVTDEGGSLKAEVSGAEDIVFRNSYTPDPAIIGGDTAITAVKQLEGKELEAGDHEFRLERRNKVLRAVNDVEGNVTFGDIKFDREGRYDYTLSETPAGSPGIVYDNTVYIVSVDVTDKGGYLDAEVTYFRDREEIRPEEAVFTNRYSPQEATVRIEAVKVLEGREIRDGEFEFELKDSRGEIIDTAAAGKDGTVTFDIMTFDKEAVHEYTISEKAGSDSSICYDDSISSITVDVRDTGKGYYTAEVFTEDDLLFTNIYTGKPAPDDDGTDTGDGSAAAAAAALMLIMIAGAGLIYGVRKHRN